MQHKIILPVCELEVELAVLTWAESKDFFKQAAKFLDDGGENDAWMEKVLSEHYPQKLLKQVMKAAPDARALYNDTVRFNKMGPEAIKNSSRSGIGAPTQTGSDTAEPAAKQTPTE